LEHVAALAAAEAVEEGRLGAHVERRRLLLVERAQPLPRRPHLAQGDVVGDQADHVRRSPHLLDEAVREGHGYSFSSTTVTPPRPSAPRRTDATWGCPSRKTATAFRSFPSPKPWITRTSCLSASSASSSALSTRGSASSTVMPTRFTSEVP